MNKLSASLFGVGVMALLSGSALASETEDKAAGIKCFPAKGLVKMVRKFKGLKPDRIDTVNTVPTMIIKTTDGGAMPERVFFRNGGEETGFNFDESGNVTDFKKIGDLSKKGELCMQDKIRAAKPDGESGIEMDIDFDVLFRNKSGTHTMAELLDGTKDGKSHYKKMFPGPMSIFVPKMTHVGIEYQGDDIPPQISAMKAGQKLDGLTSELFGGVYVVGIEQLQGLGADSLGVAGGAYTLTPMPSVKKMKALGFSEEDDN